MAAHTPPFGWDKMVTQKAIRIPTGTATQFSLPKPLLT